jgi:Reverse transcriptase (RNA-dependent DNA polymerase)
VGILIIGKKDKEITEATTILSKLYEVKVMGIARYFLGVGVHRDQDGGIGLSRQSYITRMCDKFYLTDAKPVTSPIDAGQMCNLRSTEPATAEEFINVTIVPYRELNGGLLFVATRTRPDVAAAEGILARRIADPREIDWQAAKRVLRYLKGTASLALTFLSSGDVNVTMYADADYATSSDRKSVSGVEILLGDNAVTDWISQKQKAVALSTAEAEYISQLEAVRETMWLRKALLELGLGQKEPTTVFQDNSAAIAWSEEFAYTKRSKHIDVRYHFSAEQVRHGNVIVKFVGTKYMFADSLTKPLSGQDWKRQRERLGLYPVPEKKK